MATQISINALNNPQNLITGTGLTNFVVLAQTVYDFVRDPNFGGLLSQAGTGSIPAAAIRPLPANKIQTATLSGSNFAGGQIARFSITEQDIANNGVVSRNITNGNITNEKIASGIDGAKLTDGTVTNAKLATGIDGAKLTDGTVTNAKLATGIDGGKITAGAVAAAYIANLSTDKLTDGTLPVGRGGTGQTSIAGIRTALSIDRISNNTGNTGISINGSISTSSNITVGSGGLTVTAGGLTVTAGGLTVTAGGLTISNGGLAVTGNITATGDITAFNTSDKRLKDNIVKIADPLEKVDKISGVTFNWNETYKKIENIKDLPSKDVGVLAQEILEVLPEAVTLKDNGYYGVRYEKIIPLIIESIKELSLKIKDLESKLN